MKSFLQKNHRLVFYGMWLLLGLMQAGLTELQDDEAYYWVFSRYLDWGYFDHPPMTALLVKMGYAIFPNELGVRLFPLLLNILSLIIIEKLTYKKNPVLFYVIALSVAVIQVAGFMAVPDIPLIFFTAFFFLLYKRLLDTPSLVNAILLGLSIALLMYSKYHAVLIVVFALLSNIRLFTKYHIYVAGIVSILLFAPHLWWQYQHDWVSFRYHLFESNVNPYKPSFTFSYIIGQLLLPGPIAGFILLPAAFLYKPKNLTENALRFSMIGIYLFFLLSSFRGKVEGNWTSPALVSMIILSHQYLNEKLKWQKLVYKLLPVTLLLVLVARVIMIEDLVPLKAVKERYHSWKDWPAIMNKNTKEFPIVFSNSYQRASKYWFYSGQTTLSLNNYKGRKNNYNLWPIEDSMLGKPVYYLDIYDLERFPDTLKTPIGDIGYKFDPAFSSFGKVIIVPEKNKYRINGTEKLSINFSCEFPELYKNYILRNQNLKNNIVLALYNSQKWLKDFPVDQDLQQLLQNINGTISVEPGLPSGKYYLRFAIGSGEYPPTHNSDKIELIIE